MTENPPQGIDAPPAPPAAASSANAEFIDWLKKKESPALAKGWPDWLLAFPSSGLFFMIVGAVILWMAYDTMGKAHAAMSFVLVVMGVAILLYGTGTQGIGQLQTGESAEKVAGYKVALAGGAGVLAFCVAGGIIAFTNQIKDAFRIEQSYVRLQITGNTDYAEDIGRYVPDVRVNGERVPAVRRGDRIEVYAPFIKKFEDTKLEIRAKMVLVDTAGGLLDQPEDEYKIVLTKGGRILDGGVDRGQFDIDAGYDFPKYKLNKAMNLKKPTELSGVPVQ